MERSWCRKRKQLFTSGKQRKYKTILCAKLELWRRRDYQYYDTACLGSDVWQRGSKGRHSTNGGTSAFSTNTDTVNITVNELGELNIEIDSTTEQLEISTYGELQGSTGRPQNADADYQLSNSDNTLTLSGNTWAKAAFGGDGYTITSNTILSFNFESNYVGEIHAIGFDDDNNMDDANETLFELYGTQDWGITDYQNYTEGAGEVTYTIKPGDHFTGTYQYITFVMDDDIDMH